MSFRLGVALFLFSTLALAADPPAPSSAAKAAARVKEVIGHKGSCADRPGNSLAGVLRAIEVGAHVAEVDVRTTRDGVLVCLHDAELEPTTDGTGKVGETTSADVKKLDVGAKFNPKYEGERVPLLREVLALSKGRIGVMLDLKESGGEYAKRVAAEVRRHGDPKRTVLGIRSVEQAEQFRKLVPEARQIGLIPTVQDIEPFAKAGVPVVRLWPKWLSDPALVPRVRKLGLELHLGIGLGTEREVLPLLAYEPESLSSDDPGRLIKTLRGIAGPTTSK